MPSAVPRGLADSCSVDAHDTGSNSEFNLTCTRDIVAGKVTIAVNRGGRSHMAVSQPPGDTLACSAFGTGNGGQPTERLDCEGSLLANTTAQLVASLNMFTVPCDLPSFKGMLTVRFGDGTSFGPRAIGPYRCTPKTHLRRFSQFDSGSTPQGQGYIGEIDPKDGFARCVLRSPIWIQKQSGGRWLTVLRTHASNRQRPAGGTTFTGLVLGPGVYRAFAPSLHFGNQICPAVASGSAPH